MFSDLDYCQPLRWIIIFIVIHKNKENNLIMKNEAILNDVNELKNTKKAFIIYMIGEICQIIGMLSMGANYKFLPRWLETFAFFSLIGYFLILVALCLIRKLHKTFTYSLITVGILSTLMLFAEVCSTSNEYIYIAWGKGLTWTNDVLLCIVHIYFFQGCIFLFRKYKDEKMEKDVKWVAIIYFIIFAVFMVFKIGTYIPSILKNTVANRVFVYGSILFELVSYVYVMVNVVRIAIRINLIRKEEDHEIGEIEATTSEDQGVL